MNSALRLKYFISIVSVLLFVNSVQCYAQNFLVKRDMRLDWVFYDKDEKVMLPFLDNSKEYPVAIHLSVDLDHGNEAYLVMDIPAGTSLFLENKFVKHYEKEAKHKYSLDSLSNVFKRSTIQLRLYNKESFTSPTDTKIGFLHRGFDAVTNVNPISKRNIDGRSEYLKIIILVLFTFFVVLQSLFPSDLFEFLSFRTLITFRYTDTLLSKYRSITKTQILVIIYQAALLSGVLIVFLNYYSNPFEKMSLLTINPILGWLSFLGIILVLFMLKYLLISMLSFLFGLDDRINFYFVEFLRMSMIFYSILFLVVSYTVINRFYSVENLLDNLVMFIVVFNVLRFFLLYFKFRSTVAMKNLHLFSYLCTTELIPIIIGIRFFIK